MSSKERHSWQEGEASSGEISGEKSRPSNLKRNCGRWWWAYLLILIIIVVVIVIPIIFVAVKDIVQREVNKAHVDIEQQILSAPGEKTIDVTLNTTVIGSQGHVATVEAYNQSFYMLDTLPNPIPFMYAEVPTSATNGELRNTTAVNIYAANNRISNMTEFSRYTSAILNNQSLTIGVRGNPHVKLRGLPKYTVSYDNTIEMQGFNKFSGFSISNLQLYPYIPQGDGATMTGAVSFNNPSKIEIQFGNVTMDLYSSDVYLGYALLQYLDYKPGTNLVNMRGYVNLTLASEYAQNNVLPLDIKGNSSVNIGGQHLTYFEDALKTVEFKYSLNLGSS